MMSRFGDDSKINDRNNLLLFTFLTFLPSFICRIEFDCLIARSNSVWVTNGFKPDDARNIDSNK
jgi:hypothetical protein